MRDEKKQQSIRAARDWLDEADASLSKGSGIRGDLKVMLAQAELRHAQEDEPEARGTVWRRRLARLLPLTAAAVIAALAFYLTPAVAPPQETAGISMPPAEMQEQPSDGTEAAVPSEAAAEDGSTAEAPENTPPACPSMPHRQLPWLRQRPWMRPLSFPQRAPQTLRQASQILQCPGQACPLPFPKVLPPAHHSALPAPPRPARPSLQPASSPAQLQSSWRAQWRPPVYDNSSSSKVKPPVWSCFLKGFVCSSHAFHYIGFSRLSQGFSCGLHEFLRLGCRDGRRSPCRSSSRL